MKIIQKNNNEEDKPEFAKGSGKKKSKATGPRKNINQKKNPKATKKPQVLFNTISPTIPCSSCQSNYTSFVIGSKSKCLKYGTLGLLSSAVSTCVKDGSRPPLPRNAEENTDLLSYFLSIKDRKHLEFALDLSDVKNEGDFISSTGQKINFTNWPLKGPDNKTEDHDFVTMWSDGKWNVNHGNHMSVVICEMNCPLCKFLYHLNIINSILSSVKWNVSNSEHNYQR